MQKERPLRKRAPHHAPISFLGYGLADDGPAFEVQRFARGHVAERFGVHGHHFHEFVVCDGGSGSHRIAHEERRIARGDVDIVGEGVVHDTRGLGDATGWMLLVRADERAAMLCPEAAHAFDVGRAPRVRLEPAAFPRVIAALEAIGRERRERRRGYRVVMRAHLTIVLTELARAHEAAVVSTASTLLERVVRVIDTHLANEIRLETLAHAVAMAPGYLTSELRRSTGRTAMQWVTARRLRAAQHRLLETDDAVATIAAETGFADGGHFARRFREAFDATPAAWRAHSRLPNDR